MTDLFQNNVIQARGGTIGRTEESLSEAVGRALSVTTDSAPRAGQYWDIVNAFFSFPNSTRQQEPAGPFPENVVTRQEYIFEIKMFIGGVEVAKQEIIEGESALQGTKVPLVSMHLLGSLEFFRQPRVYAGQDIRFTYNLRIKGYEPATENKPLESKVIVGPGQIVLGYTLHSRSPR